MQLPPFHWQLLSANRLAVVTGDKNLPRLLRGRGGVVPVIPIVEAEYPARDELIDNESIAQSFALLRTSSRAHVSSEKNG
jgi:hypothetical protein